MSNSTFVNGTDFAQARDNPRNFLNRAPVDFPYDYNRDSFVDQVIKPGGSRPRKIGKKAKRCQASLFLALLWDDAEELDAALETG